MYSEMQIDDVCVQQAKQAQTSCVVFFFYFSSSSSCLYIHTYNMASRQQTSSQQGKTYQFKLVLLGKEDVQ